MAAAVSKPPAHQLVLALVAVDWRAPGPFPGFFSGKTVRRVSPVDNVARPPLHLVENQPDVFTNHAQKEKLYPAKEAQGGDQGRPALHFGLAKRIEQQFADATEQAEHRDHEAEADTKSQRHFRKRADS